MGQRSLGARHCRVVVKAGDVGGDGGIQAVSRAELKNRTGLVVAISPSRLTGCGGVALVTAFTVVNLGMSQP